METASKTLEAVSGAVFKSWFVDFDPVKAKAKGREPESMDAATAALFPDSFEESSAGRIPAGWQLAELRNHIDFNPPRTLKKAAMSTYLDMANVPTSGPTAAAVSMRTFGSGCKFVNGDTLFAKITPCLENGKTAFVDFLNDDETGWGSTELIVIRPRPPIPNEFAYLLSRQAAFREYAERGMTGTSGRQRVPPDHLKRYQLAFAPSEIYVAFERFVWPVFQSIRANADLAETLGRLRDTLLPRLISGKLRTWEAEKLVASAI